MKMTGGTAIVSKENCFWDVFYGTDYDSHLGTVNGGMAIYDGERIRKEIKDISSSSFRSKLEEFAGRMEGCAGIGVISDYEPQPLVFKSHLGEYAIVHIGRIDNLEELVEEIDKPDFSEILEDGKVNPIELISYLMNRGDNFVSGIENVQDKIKGSCSLMVLTGNKVYIARDEFGRTPLSVARREEDGSWGAFSENCSVYNPGLDRGFEEGYEVVRELGPGEIGELSVEGYDQKKKPGEEMQICAFLYVYYGFPASVYEGINVELSRYRCGEALARVDDAEVDMVAGIPDSGTPHAIGYANEKRIPYRRPFVKYTATWPRSFMPQVQEVRNLVAKMKLIPIRELIEGKRILFCEDSIVRGTQLQDTIKRLYKNGVREVHMRPACPPLIHGCKFLNFSRSTSVFDLAGRRAIRDINAEEGKEIGLIEYKEGSERHGQMIEKIRERLGLTSLRYQKLDDLVSAIGSDKGLPKEKLCTYCWDGHEGPDCSGCVSCDN